MEPERARLSPEQEEQLKKALEQSGRGDVVSLGSFIKYVEEGAEDE